MVKVIKQVTTTELQKQFSKVMEAVDKDGKVVLLYKRTRYVIEKIDTKGLID